jgi:tetratricopeptide (TPR) repeat protein
MKTIKTLIILLLCNIGFAQLSKPDFEVAMQLLQGNNPEKALANLESLEKKFPADAQVIFLRGFYQFRDGNQNGAMMSFSNAIKSNPKLAIAYGGRAQLFAAKGMLDKAIVDISEAVKIEPKNIDFITTRSGFYYDNKQFDLGLADMKSKIVLDPKNINGYFDAAVFEKSINQNANADVYFEQAYANKGIQKFVTDVLFGKYLLKYGRYDEAKIKYEAALSTNEKDFGDEDFNNVAIVYYKLKNYDKAILYFGKALAMQPSNVDYRNNLCGVFVDQKNWQILKETAETSIRNGTDSPMAHMYYAIGLKYTGFESLAIEYEKKAKELEAEQNK